MPPRLNGEGHPALPTPARLAYLYMTSGRKIQVALSPEEAGGMIADAASRGLFIIRMPTIISTVGVVLLNVESVEAD